MAAQQPNQLLSYLMQAQGPQIAQTATDILNNTGAGQMLGSREAFLNGVHGDEQNSLNNLLNNKAGGYYVNAAPLQGQQNTNVVTDNSMTLNALLGLIQNATSAQNNAVNAGVTAQDNANNYDVNSQNAASTRLNANVGAANSGWNTDGSGNITNNNQGANGGAGSGNPRIDNYVNAVMNGYKSIADVPQDITPRVLSELQLRGYDPAKEVWGDLNTLQNYYGKNGGLAMGNNPVGAGLMKGQDLLSLLGIKTAPEANKQDYGEAVKNFQSKYANIFGKDLALPSTKDTPEQAKNKWAAITKTIHNKFYNGGSGPGASGGTKDPLNLGL